MVALKTLVALAAVPLALAHPGENKEAIKREMAMRNAQHAIASRALSKCRDSPQAVELRSRAAARRAAKATQLRTMRGLVAKPLMHQKRDLENLEKWATLNHNETSFGYTLDTPAGTIFGSNNTCALVPETTVGPYYVTGELIRQDITEGQAGVPLHLDMQFVDINTCLPIVNAVTDIWSCNATGTYSGVTGEGGLNSTFIRGVQITDDDGVTQFDTVFPGHYDRRLTHIHVVSQTDFEVLPNATYTGGKTLHIGQLYFDDSLVKQVEANLPYSTNTIAYTSMEDDGWALDEATTDYDPFVEYVQLSDDVNDGLLAWITIGLDQGSDHTSNLTAAAHYYEGGGQAVNNSFTGGPPSE
ncbi:Intradiol ring-cleavage dioxygenase [Xylariales sp. AK1849]|nr:Intradiol ring-cleavage dioxygenase [Xylariales sp. AK1849]